MGNILKYFGGKSSKVNKEVKKVIVEVPKEVTKKVNVVTNKNTK